MSQTIELDLDMDEDDAVSQTRFSGMLSTESDHERNTNSNQNRHSEIIQARLTYGLQRDLEVVLEEESNVGSEFTR